MLRNTRKNEIHSISGPAESALLFSDEGMPLEIRAWAKVSVRAGLGARTAPDYPSELHLWVSRAGKRIAGYPPPKIRPRLQSRT